jgi:hypothetical protein
MKSKKMKRFGPRLDKDYEENTRCMFNEMIELHEDGDWCDFFSIHDLRRMIAWMLRRRPDNDAKFGNMQFLFKAFHEFLEDAKNQKEKKDWQQRKAKRQKRLSDGEKLEEDDDEDGVLSYTSSTMDDCLNDSLQEIMYGYHRMAKYATFDELSRYLRQILQSEHYESESDLSDVEEEEEEESIVLSHDKSGSINDGEANVSKMYENV